MKCPKCGADMVAMGGIPTVWQCPTCSKSAKKAVRYVGDTKDLEMI